MGEQWRGTYVPHTPCPLHISLALQQQDDRLGEFVRGHRGEATHSCLRRLTAGRKSIGNTVLVSWVKYGGVTSIVVTSLFVLHLVFLYLVCLHCALYLLPVFYV